VSGEAALIESLLEKYQGMTDEEKVKINAEIDARSKNRLWLPTPGPQLDAVNCLADVLLYGGEGGGGKTDLGIGIAFECHKKSLLVRKQYTDLTGLTDRAKEINGTDKGFNGSSPPRLKTVNGKIMDFAGVDKPGDEDHWQGRPHDLLYIDEAVQLREKAVRFLMGWVRDASGSGQRTRTILGSNPPIDSTGDWIIAMFAPWLDTNWPENKRAKHGELRWVVTMIDDSEKSFDYWVDGPDVKIPSGRTNPDGSPKFLIPESRTFIPAHLEDNPFLAADGKYAAKLDAMQEPLRSAIRDGNFMAARVDADDQLIPSKWVWRSHNRWTVNPPPGVPMCAIGVDAARKKDETVLAPRYDGYYPKLITMSGAKTPTGKDVAGLIIKHRRDGATPSIDCGERNGAEAYGHLESNGIECHRHVGIDPSSARSEKEHLKFFNKRAEVYWKFMEALDPNQDGGSPIALPDDAMLRSDLTAVRWKLTPNGIKLTPKDELVKILGRSPDRGDAVVQAWATGEKAITDAMEWRKDQGGGMIGKRKRPKVNMGSRRRNR